MLNNNILNIVLFSPPIYQLIFYTVQLFPARRRNDPSRVSLGFLMLLMLLYLAVNALGYIGYAGIYKFLYVV